MSHILINYFRGTITVQYLGRRNIQHREAVGASRKLHLSLLVTRMPGWRLGPITKVAVRWTATRAGVDWGLGADSLAWV